jgi:hypothetical protein
VSREFEHADEPRAEEIALHQRFLTLLSQMEAAQSEGNTSEVQRLRLPLERARKRWLRGKRPRDTRPVEGARLFQ